MKISHFVIIATGLSALSACMAQAPDQKPATKAASVASETSSRSATNEISQGGLVFDVDASRTIARVSAKSGTVRLSENQLEAATQKATGCKANFEPGVLTFIGGYTADTPLPLKPDSKFPVNLTC